MPKININGITRNMTSEEQAEYERMIAEMDHVQALPSPEERLAALEAALAERDMLIADLLTRIN